MWDGSVRLNTPLSPAIQLGARRIVIISPHSEKSFETTTAPMPGPRLPSQLGRAHRKTLQTPSSRTRLKYDISQLHRIDRLIDASEKGLRAELHGVRQQSGLAPIMRSIRSIIWKSPQASRSRPSFGMVPVGGRPKWHLSFMERFFMRLLDISPAFSHDLLSYLTFEKDYLSRLVDVGFEDAKAQHDKICAFLEQGL
jgi:NTE family protein